LRRQELLSAMPVERKSCKFIGLTDNKMHLGRN